LLFGEYLHTLDIKGRVSFPAKLCESLGETFYITKGIDGCLAVFSADGLNNFSDKLLKNRSEKEIRKLQRYFVSHKIEPDKQGRILIPAILREFAGLDKNVMIIGAFDRVEIWDKEQWDKEQTLTDEDVAEMIENRDKQ
jgi:MraZ protein